MTAGKYRVVVWATGGIGSIAIRTITNRPDLELVGVWVHSDDKVGLQAKNEATRTTPAAIGATMSHNHLALVMHCVSPSF